LITEGHWTAAAHEIGHIYGLAMSQEEYITHPPGNSASGFWVSPPLWVNSQAFPVDGYCFMGGSDWHTVHGVWVDTADFINLFQQFRNNPTDPEVILMSALLHSDGTVDLQPWYFLPNGVLDESIESIISGNYAVRVVDVTGQILSEVTLPVEFIMHIDPLGIQPTDIVPLLVSIPYFETAERVEIVSGGQVLSSTLLSTKLLRDAINAIPDFGFVNLHTERRIALLNKVDAIENMIQVGATKGEISKITQDLKPKIEAWIVDGYVKTQPTQLEKAEVLTLIDKMVIQIMNLGK